MSAPSDSTNDTTLEPERKRNLSPLQHGAVLLALVTALATLVGWLYTTAYLKSLGAEWALGIIPTSLIIANSLNALMSFILAFFLTIVAPIIGRFLVTRIDGLKQRFSENSDVHACVGTLAFLLCYFLIPALIERNVGVHFWSTVILFHFVVIIWMIEEAVTSYQNSKVILNKQVIYAFLYYLFLFNWVVRMHAGNDAHRDGTIGLSQLHEQVTVQDDPNGDWRALLATTNGLIAVKLGDTAPTKETRLVPYDTIATARPKKE